MKRYRPAKPTGMKIIIVGCGKVGATLTEQLSREGHDITVVDQNPSVVQLSHSTGTPIFAGADAICTGAAPITNGIPLSAAVGMLVLGSPRLT